MAESENQLELQKRARRRLVGSVALALTAAIVLPMVMDHEPKPLTQDIQIRIPSQDSASVPRPAPSRPAVPESDTSRPAVKPAADPVPAPDAVKPVQKPADSASGKPEATPPAKPEVKPAPKPEPKSEPDAKAEPKADAKDAAKVARQSKVEAILSGNEPPASAGQFVVQLGAFGDPANVTKVRTRVKAAGFRSYTETLKGPKGNQTRVRAGPFASREAAEQAAAKLKHAGLAGVVAPK